MKAKTKKTKTTKTKCKARRRYGCECSRFKGHTGKHRCYAKYNGGCVADASRSWQ